MSSKPTETEGRIIDLEIRLTHQDRLLDELNAVLVQQQMKLQQIDDRLKRLESGAEPDEGE